MNIPILITLFRMLAIPIFIFIYYLPTTWAHPVACMIFIFAAFTDWLDGYLARSLSQQTRLGAFLDPVADKLLVAVTLVLVVGQNYIALLALPAAIIVGREIAISALREWMAEMGKRTSIAVSFVAKVKTTLQMLSLILLIWYAPGRNLYILWAGATLLYIAAILTLWTMIIYLKIAWPDLTSAREKQ